MAQVEITVADDIFDNPGMWPGDRGTYEKDPDFLVISEDHEQAAAALHAAAMRFSLVTSSGREIEEWENNGTDYTPNYISDVHLSDSGPYLWTDTKGELTAAMGETMLQILTEELVSRGVGAHITAVPHDIGEHPVWNPPHPAAPPEQQTPSPKAWFLIRTVWRSTSRGRNYQDVEYWNGSGWTRLKAEALTWEEPPNDLATRLRKQPSGPEYGQPTGLLMSTDPGADPWPMPPDKIRWGGPATWGSEQS